MADSELNHPLEKPKKLSFLWTLPGFALAASMLCLIDPPSLYALGVLPRLVWPVAGIGLQILFWRHRKSFDWWLGIAIWAAFCLFLLEEPTSVLRGLLAHSTQEPKAQETVIVSLNCAGSPSPLADIEPLQPDVVLLQESPSAETLQGWAQSLFGEEGSVVWGRDCSIIARGNLDPLREDPLARATGAIWKKRDGERILVISLRLPPPPVRVDYWNPACWSTYRELHNRQSRQASELPAVIQQFELPAIVGGDWNCPAGSAVEQPLKKLGMKDGFQSEGRGWGKTISNDFPFHRIDRVWFSDEFKPLSVTAIRTKHSDHRAVRSVVE